MDRIAWKRLAIGVILGCLASAIVCIEKLWIYPLAEHPQTIFEYLRNGGWAPIGIGAVMGLFAGIARSRKCPKCGGTVDVVSIPKDRQMIYRCKQCGEVYFWQAVVDHKDRGGEG